MIITEKNVNEENKMNFAPLLLILLFFWKSNPSWVKNVLPRLDLPSFAPLFKILGLNDKTVSFLTSEKFAAALSAVFDNDSADLKSILPALIGLLSSQSKAEEEKKAASEEKSSEAADVTAAYFTPVKDIMPEDVSESLSEYLH